MNPTVRINCRDIDWQNSLRSMLREKKDADLTNVNIEYDREYLEQLAKKEELFFTYDSETNTGFFRKEKLNL